GIKRRTLSMRSRVAGAGPAPALPFISGCCVSLAWGGSCRPVFCPMVPPLPRPTCRDRTSERHAMLAGTIGDLNRGTNYFEDGGFRHPARPGAGFTVGFAGGQTYTNRSGPEIMRATGGGDSWVNRAGGAQSLPGLPRRGAAHRCGGAG